MLAQSSMPLQAVWLYTAQVWRMCAFACACARRTTSMCEAHNELGGELARVLLSARPAQNVYQLLSGGQNAWGSLAN